MPVDIRRLRPAELVRLLNSTKLGEVFSPRWMQQHRQRAGFQISPDGDGSRIDLLRYAAWLVWRKHAPPPPRPAAANARPGGGDDYEDIKERSREQSRAKSLLGRDIGKLPRVKDRRRRDRCRGNFRAFCELYLRATFPLAWSADHLKVIEKIQQAVLTGGLFAMAMPRGSGKTSLCEAGCLWAVLYGHRRYVVVIGADKDNAETVLESMSSELARNDRLADDFPEVCVPVRRLEGIVQRAAGQLCLGKPTAMEWTADGIVLPTIPGSKASGAVIRVVGLTGGIRGMKRKMPDGSSVRPDLVLVDDPQTDDSARSPTQTANRERTIKGSILGLAGPGEQIAGLMAVTVIEKNDLAERMLDRSLHPEWQGERLKMVYRWPDRMDLWQEYIRLRREDMTAGQPDTRAVAFYRANRAEMDKGAEVAWKERKSPGELSALQHAFNLKMKHGDAGFAAEFQNDPLARDETGSGEHEITAVEFARRYSGLGRGIPQHGAQWLTGFIDVQGAALYWMVCAWDERFGGSIIDYGTEPEQSISYFALRDIRRNLMAAAPGAALEGAIQAGLQRLTSAMMAKTWFQDGSGVGMRVERLLIDANWGEMTELVYQFCRSCPHAMVLPSHGRYVGASSMPFNDYRRQRGDRVGLNWRMPCPSGKRPTRYILFDANYWKTAVHARGTTAVGDPGALTVFGTTIEQHRLLCDQLASEYRVRTSGRGRLCDEWKIRVPGRDNHWLDCLVGCAVGASMLGAVPPGLESSGAPRPRRKVSVATMMARRRAH